MTTTPDILVIEDDPIMREPLTDLLRAAAELLGRPAR
jgi:hypothetical protein